MGQVPTGIKAHPENGVARLQQCGKHALIGLTARIGLHVGKFAFKQLTGAFNRQRFGHIDELASAIIAPADIAFGVFVGHHTALSLHDGD